MKILVCISHVPDTTAKINFKNNETEFDKEGVQFVINPNDEFGLTKAMILKETLGGNVTVINVGDASTEPTLRKALAIGADDAIRVDRVPKDAYTVASDIAEEVKAGGYDLILGGIESIDYNGGQVMAMVAALCNLPIVDTCVGLSVVGNKATAMREIDGGKETLETTLPLVIAGKKGLVEEKDLRIPNMRGIMMARTKKLEVKSPTSATEKVADKKYEKPAARGNCKMISADNVGELVELLHNEAKVI